MLSIIIPTYNESGNIDLLVSSLSKLFDNYEIIFVDDNSSDGTAEKIKSNENFNKTVFLLSRPSKLGLATAVNEGVKISKGEWILVMDADMSHPPKIAKKLFDNSVMTDLVIASRNLKGSGDSDWGIHRDIISKTAESLCRPLIGNSISDPLSGFFLVKKEVFLKTKVRVKGYKILLNILYDNKKLKTKEVPYRFEARHYGKTKLSPSEIFNYIFDLLRLLKS